VVGAAWVVANSLARPSDGASKLRAYGAVPKP
jgi:hypothetical protein